MVDNYNFKLEHSFDKPFSNIYDFILDFKKFGHFHPNMKEVTVVSQQSLNNIEYEVNEEVVLYGFIKIYPNYKATVLEMEKNKHIKYLSQVKKNIFLTIDFTFSQNIEVGTTYVTESVDVKSNKIVASIFLKLLKKAHLQTFDNFKTNDYVI